MEFNTYAISILCTILVIVSLVYLGYILYNDTLELKKSNTEILNELAKIKENFEEIEETSEYAETEPDNEEESEDDNISHNNEFLDDIVIPYEKLQQIQMIQKEFSNPCLETIEELPEEDYNEVNHYYVMDTYDIPNELSKSNKEFINSDKIEDEIVFTSVDTEEQEQKSCLRILKSGKNLGKKCGKVVVNDTDFCKHHSN